MGDAIGAIGAATASGAPRVHAMTAHVGPESASSAAGAPAAQATAGDALVARLRTELMQARALGAEAERAAAAVRSGASSDVEGVLLATRKADAAFQMLQAVRNAMLDAYAQIRDMRA